MSKCVVCGREKSVFVAGAPPSKKKQAGKGVDKFISKIPSGVELHLLGSYHPESFNSADPSLRGAKNDKTMRMEFAGPNTKTDERYAKRQRGINDLDHGAMFHDFAYKSKDPATRNKADKVLQEKVRAYLKKPELTRIDKVDAHIVDKVMGFISNK